MAWVVLSVAALGVAILLAPVFALISLVVLITGVVSIARGSRTWLRFRSRKSAISVTAIASVVFLMTGGISNALFSSRQSSDPVAIAAPSIAATSTSSSTPSAKLTPTPTPTPTPTETIVQLMRVIDGDTIETSAGTVRLIGIDTPEEGAWGYAESTAELSSMIAAGSTLALVAVADRDDTDQYGRLLRYVRVDGQDAGRYMIDTGWAVARYDSRDGYGGHPLQTDYVALDAAKEMPAQPAPAPAPAPAEPAPQPAAPATDPQFRTCGEANDNGYGDYQKGVDPEYDWYRDRDRDGWVCER